jgi:hypothetical protein
MGRKEENSTPINCTLYSAAGASRIKEMFGEEFRVDNSLKNKRLDNYIYSKDAMETVSNAVRKVLMSQSPSRDDF